MQQHSPSEIKEKLLQALDRDYHVVDMALAMEAVSLLEKTAITKEALETTRLGRIVNEMRKKTKNDTLAKRAKDLVRRWRDMVAKPSENGSGGTGQGPGQVPQVNHFRMVGGKNSVSSPALCELSRLSSPALRPGLVISPTSPAFRGITISPGLRKSIHPAHVISPSNSVASNASTSPGLSFSLSQTHSNSSRPSTPSSLVAKSKAISPGPGRPGELQNMCGTSLKSNNSNRALKRTRDDEDTMTGFEISGKRSRASNGVDGLWAAEECSRDSNFSWSGTDSLGLNQSLPAGVNDDQSLSSSSKTGRLRTKKVETNSPDHLKEKLAFMAKNPKVKTTQELVRNLKDRKQSISPTVPTIKTEPSVNHQRPPLISSAATHNSFSAERLLPKVEMGTVPSHPSSSSSKVVKLSARDEAAEILARLPPLDPSLAWQEETVEEDVSDDVLPPPPVPATEEDVNRLHTDPVDNVNGSRDWRNEFHGWHETVSVSSFQEDLLHLLPYVVIE